MLKADPDDARYFDNQDHEGDQKGKVDKELRDELERLHHRHLLCQHPGAVFNWDVVHCSLLWLTAFARLPRWAWRPV
jgi:hypothetical protein